MAPVREASRSLSCHGRTAKGCLSSTSKAERRPTLVLEMLGQAAVPLTLLFRSRRTRPGHAEALLASFFVPCRPTRLQLGSEATAKSRLTLLRSSGWLNRIQAPLRNGASTPIGPGQGRRCGRWRGWHRESVHVRKARGRLCSYRSCTIPAGYVGLACSEPRFACARRMRTASDDSDSTTDRVTGQASPCVQPRQNANGA